MIVRSMGFLVGLLCLALIVWVAVVAVDSEGRVLPTNGVIGGEQADDPVEGLAGRAVLSERTELMRWRGESGPAPSEVAPLALGSQADVPASIRLGVLPDEGPRILDDEPEALFANWLARAQEDEPLLRSPEFVEGSSSIPGRTMEVFEQPQGRFWREAHNGTIAYGGGFYIFGVAALLAFFLGVRGRVKVKDGFSGVTVQRFNALERANHWMTATSFVLLALTGVVILYGKSIIRPWLGAEAFADLAQGSVWLHIALLVPFTLGIAMMIGMWVWQNVITGIDLQWLKRGGGMVNPNVEPPPTPRFNAGQKLIFWLVVIGGLTLVATGMILMFPFLFFGYDGMQIAQALHAVAGLGMIGVIIGHIYIGTVGMEGAFDAMWSGQVDKNWAREHHSIWHEKLVEKGKAPPEPAE